MAAVPTETEIHTFLTSLSETPGRIAAASNELAPVRLHFKPSEDAWSASDILAHLRACADVWGKSMLTMLAQDHPTLRYVSPRAWIRKTDYLSLDFHVSLLAFSAQRTKLLETLTALPMPAWSRGATFTGTTNGREQTVFSYARRMALHENEHCAEIEMLLK